MREGCRCQKREDYEEQVNQFVIHVCVTQFTALLKGQTLGHPATKCSPLLLTMNSWLFFVWKFYDDQFVVDWIVGIFLVVRQHWQLQAIRLAGANDVGHKAFIVFG